MGENLLLPEENRGTALAAPPAPSPRKGSCPKFCLCPLRVPYQWRGSRKLLEKPRSRRGCGERVLSSGGQRCIRENRAEAIAMGGACLAWLCALGSKAGNPWGGHGVRAMAGRGGRHFSSVKGKLLMGPRAHHRRDRHRARSWGLLHVLMGPAGGVGRLPACLLLRTDWNFLSHLNPLSFSLPCPG